MRARDPEEAHRASTPLELLFDLCFVVAVAEAAGHLHHAMVAGHALAAVPIFIRIFFAIWWAWMNFTWFASAYDSDDVVYRLLVLVQIAGVLVLSAGVSRGLDDRDFTIMTVGYAIMRVGLVSLWLRAAFHNPGHRKTALRYAVGVTVVEFGWLAVLWLPPALVPYAWLIGVPAELLIPIWAECAGATPWHAGHITERYGLLTLIVLGESVLAATNAIDASLDAAHLSFSFLAHIGGCILIVFAMWWLYFNQSAHHRLRSTREAFIWGYGHYFVFAAIAAVGAGLAASSDVLLGHVEAGAHFSGLVVAIPVVIYLVSVWALEVRPFGRGLLVDVAFFVAAALTLALSFSVLAIGLVLSALVVVLILSL